MGRLLAAYPSLEKYMARLEQRPAYKRSIERGGQGEWTEQVRRRIADKNASCVFSRHLEILAPMRPWLIRAQVNRIARNA